AASALTASSIGDCPALSPRKTNATSVKDLRPDDIKVIGAMGDSIMAGFGISGIDPDGTGILNISAVMESRGKSWAIGGDEGAFTVANFMQHYSPKLQGPSKGEHIAEICQDILCLDYRFPDKDVLNGALSGAIAVNLDNEFDYMLKQMKSMESIDFDNDWKLITIQIGSNDQCASCLGPWTNDVKPENYGSYVDKVIGRIKDEMPRTIVDLGGVFNVSQVYNLTFGQDYCRPLLDQPNALLNRVECPCFLESDDKIRNMDNIAASYNEQLVAIYEKYKAQESDTFAVTFQPADINIAGFPVDALSNLDCFHPAEKTHELVAKIYCPSEDDRI
ncbi:hypothetical protein K492DRAFT_105044, partial [Lichtheimia hyalospora FSU 10163]